MKSTLWTAAWLAWATAIATFATSTTAAKEEISFRVGGGNAKVTALQLIDARTGTIKVANLISNNTTVIDVSKLKGMSKPSFTIQAIVASNKIQRVDFSLGQGDGDFTLDYAQVGGSPYTMCGVNAQRDSVNTHVFTTCTALGVGTYTITVRACSRTRLCPKRRGSSVSATFTIVQSIHPVRSPVTTPVRPPVRSPVLGTIAAPPTDAPVTVAPTVAPVTTAPVVTAPSVSRALTTVPVVVAAPVAPLAR